MSAAQIKSALKVLADPRQAEQLQRFFKTGPGQYGHGDRFLGIKVPQLRQLAKQHLDLDLNQAAKLLTTKIHEQRLVALLILTYQYPRLERAAQEAIYRFYLAHTTWINNWDLVDLSAPKIVGAHLLDADKAVLCDLAKSQSLWERRIAIIATMYFIYHGHFTDTLQLSSILLLDAHDLIHKAVGWMLREVGKRDQKVLEEFLLDNYRRMPRTMLRYAIERLPEPRRQQYLKGHI
ncbi:MAG: DNA alkylation repair protein [Desulfobacteraceae bacterium]|nr:DNA alkylation repair protein [Desulfobacteraceae bacterium]